MAFHAPETEEYIHHAADSLWAYLGNGNMLGVLVAGKTGVGKSSLINSLIGSELAKEGATVKPVSNAVVSYTLSIDTPVYGGENESLVFTAWDSPGFGDLFIDENDLKKRLEELMFAIDKADVLLYCFKISERITRDDIDGIRRITQMINPTIWKKAVFVLTFANELKIPESSSSRSECSSPAEYLGIKLKEWKEVICDQLRKAGVPEDIVADVSVVPAGYKKKNSPGSSDWYTLFWEKLFKKTRESGKPGLLRLTWERLDISRNKATNFSEQSSANDPLPVHLFNDNDELIDVGNLAEYLPSDPSNHSLTQPPSSPSSTAAHKSAAHTSPPGSADHHSEVDPMAPHAYEHSQPELVLQPSGEALSQQTSLPPSLNGPVPSLQEAAVSPPALPAPVQPQPTSSTLPNQPSPPAASPNNYMNTDHGETYAMPVGLGNPPLVDKDPEAAAQPEDIVSDSDTTENPAEGSRFKKVAKIGAIVGGSAVVGAVIGMAIGYFVGPIGMGFGAAIGASIGAVAGVIAKALAKFMKKKRDEKKQANAEAPEP